MKFYKQFCGETNSHIPLNDESEIKKFREKYKCGCGLCPYKKMVFGYGAENPLLCIVGYAPSKDEVVNGLFTDKHNQKIQGVVQYLGRHLNIRNNIYYTTLFGCDQDIYECRNKLNEELRIINPKNIITFKEVYECVKNKLYPIDELFCKKLTIEFDKFYPCYIISSLKELYYKNDIVKDYMKQDLEFVIKNV